MTGWEFLGYLAWVVVDVSVARIVVNTLVRRGR